MLEGLAEGRDEVQVTIGGGAVLADGPGDFCLSIEVPDELLAQRRLEGDIGDEFGFKQYWLSPEEANRYRDTLKVYDSEDGEEVRLDLVGK